LGRLHEFRDFPQREIQRFDDVRPIDRPADFLRKLKHRIGLRPIRPPRFRHDRITRVPFLSKLFECEQRFIFRHGYIEFGILIWELPMAEWMPILCTPIRFQPRLKICFALGFECAHIDADILAGFDSS
jgi:hypothetical protein